MQRQKTFTVAFAPSRAVLIGLVQIECNSSNQQS